MKTKESINKEQKLNKELMQAKREQQMACEHSFNLQNKCEYCGISYDYYLQTGIGIYQ